MNEMVNLVHNIEPSISRFGHVGLEYFPKKECSPNAQTIQIKEFSSVLVLIIIQGVYIHEIV